MADQLQSLGVALGDDRDFGSLSGERRREVAELAVDLDRQRGLGQAWPDRRSGVGTRRPRLELERIPVRQGDDDFLGCGLHGRDGTGRLRPAPAHHRVTAAFALCRPVGYKQRTRSVGRALAGLADSDQRARGFAGERLSHLPEHVGLGDPVDAETREGRVLCRPFGDDVARRRLADRRVLLRRRCRRDRPASPKRCRGCPVRRRATGVRREQASALHRRPRGSR